MSGGGNSGFEDKDNGCGGLSSSFVGGNSTS